MKIRAEIVDSKVSQSLKILRRSRTVYIVIRVLHSFLTGLKYRLGWIGSKSGSFHGDLDIEESLRYIQEVVEDYQFYGGFSRISGKVAEIGPGDNVGVALLLRALGADEVDLLDRFETERNLDHQALIYKHMCEATPAIAELLQGKDFRDESSFPGLRRWCGPSAAAEVFFRKHRSYSLIVSRAVLEHCADPLSALQDMVSVLEPGGMLLHKVDLRDHGLFSPPLQELEWLTTPTRIHRLMTKNGGLPNRILLRRYRSILESTGLEFNILVTAMVGVGEIRPHLKFESIPSEIKIHSSQHLKKIRHRLSKEFNECSDEDLIVTGIFLVVRNIPAK